MNIPTLHCYRAGGRETAAGSQQAAVITRGCFVWVWGCSVCIPASRGHYTWMFCVGVGLFCFVFQQAAVITRGCFVWLFCFVFVFCPCCCCCCCCCCLGGGLILSFNSLSLPTFCLFDLFVFNVFRQVRIYLVVVFIRPQRESGVEGERKRERRGERDRQISPTQHKL